MPQQKLKKARKMEPNNHVLAMSNNVDKHSLNKLKKVNKFGTHQSRSSTPEALDELFYNKLKKSINLELINHVPVNLNHVMNYWATLLFSSSRGPTIQHLMATWRHVQCL